jgi:Bacterial dnaA protein helix-turn-helix
MKHVSLLEEKPDPFTIVGEEPAWRGYSPAVREIIKQVSLISGVSVCEIIGSRKPFEQVLARHIVAWLARNFTDRSFPAIASEIRRDHTTVIHAVKAIEESIRKGGIEPEEQTVEGWTRALLAYHRGQLRLRKSRYSARARVREASKRALRKARDRDKK